MDIILARHGNTFSAGDKIIWVGSSNDLPLVDAGREQAQNLARALEPIKTKLAGVYCGPLKRTMEAATIVTDHLKTSFEPVIVENLDEIDYGVWSGLSSDEIKAKYGAEELEAWDKKSLWPSSGVWRTKEEDLIQRVFTFVHRLTSIHAADDKLLLVSSNGVMRFFLGLIDGAFEEHVKSGTFKVKTGNICLIYFDGKDFSLKFWNEEPGPELFNSD